MTREDIVAAAADIIRQDGFAALSMRRLGADLGVDAMVPYRVLESKDALLDAVYDEVVAASRPDAGDDPVQEVMAGFRSFWYDLVANPGLMPLVAPRMLATFAAMAPFEWVLRRLLAAGVPEADALRWYTTTLAFVLGSALIHPAVQARDDRLAPADLSPVLYPAATSVGPIDHEALFAAGLAGLESQIRRETT